MAIRMALELHPDKPNNYFGYPNSQSVSCGHRVSRKCMVHNTTSLVQTDDTNYTPIVGVRIAFNMNRRQRRTQASSSSKVKSADDIPLAQPDRSQSSIKSKTLYELAAERQAALMPQAHKFDGLPSPENVVNVKIGPNGEIVRETKLEEEEGDGDKDTLAEDEAVPPLLDTLFLATSLSVLHFTLDVLTVHQYAQELLFKPIVKRAIFTAFPTLCLLIHLSRGHLLPDSMRAAASSRTRKVVTILRQVLFVALANFVGCYLIQLTNDKGYYAVMKNAPGVGTMWVWAVLELGLVGALAGVIGPAAYAWYWGYGIF